MARILMVDDEPAILAAAARVLKRMDHQVTVASNPIGALKLLSKQGRFDLVVSDLEMPLMHGDALFKKAQEFYKVPFILVSGKAEVHRRTVECGAQYSLMKPYDAEVMKDAIERLLSQP